MALSTAKTVKVIVLGNHCSGKTALVRRYSMDKFDENYAATIGLGTFRYEIPGDNIFIEFSDTCGQERFETVTKQYYRSANIAVFVFALDDMGSFDKVWDTWYPSFQSNKSDETSQLILVGTRKDLSNARIDEKAVEGYRSDAEKREMEFFMVSSKDGSGFDELRRYVNKIARDLKSVNNVSSYEENSTVSACCS